jgi:hypothetical protein
VQELLQPDLKKICQPDQLPDAWFTFSVLPVPHCIGPFIKEAGDLFLVQTLLLSEKPEIFGKKTHEVELLKKLPNKFGIRR